MSKKHVKAKQVNVLVGNNVIAASDSCDITINLNTTQGAAKDDPGAGEWDNPEATYYDWQINNQSFLIAASDLNTFLAAAIAGTLLTVKAQIDNTSSGTDFARQGSAIISNVEVTSQVDDYVKVTVSFEGASALATATATTITPASALRAKIRGKALMIAVNTGTSQSPEWHTIGCATNHTLSLSNQIGDVRCKDVNDMAPNKEVTGHSCKLTTENLIALEGDTDDAVYIEELYNLITQATAIQLQFGYYSGAVGHENTDWGAPDTLIVSGTFLCTNLAINANGTQEDATLKGEFSSKGAITVGS